MKELITQSLTPIRDVIQGQNYGIIKARLDQLLPKDVAQSFAKVFLQPKEGVWYAENDFIYIPYSEASAIEKEEISIRLEEIKEVAFGTLQDVMPYWEKLFVVPNQDCIHWCKAEDGSMHIVIAQWGFENRTIETQTDVISEIITAPRPLIQIPVVLNCQFSNGEIASDYEFYLNIFNNKKLCKTNEDGTYSVGSLFADKQFSVENVNGTQQIYFTVSSGSDYNAIFNVTTDYLLTVLNQNDTPVGSYFLKVDGTEIMTDSEGQYNYKEYILTPKSTIIVERDGEVIGTFLLSKDAKKNNFIVRIEEKIIKPKTITIKLRGYRNEPLSNIFFEIRNDKGKFIDGLTDSNGNAIIPSDGFAVGKKYNISFKVSSAYQKQQVMNRKEQKK